MNEQKPDTDTGTDGGPVQEIIHDIESMLKKMIDQPTKPSTVWQLTRLFFKPDDFSLRTQIPTHLLEEVGTRIMHYMTQLKNKTDNWMLLYNAGVMLESAGKQDQSLVCFKRILSMRPHDPEICTRIARHWEQQNDHGKWAAWMHKALDIDPTDVDILHMLGMRYFLHGRWKDSLDAFSKYLLFTDATKEWDSRHYKFACRAIKYLQRRILHFGENDRYSLFEPGEAV